MVANAFVTFATLFLNLAIASSEAPESPYRIERPTASVRT